MIKRYNQFIREMADGQPAPDTKPQTVPTTEPDTRPEIRPRPERPGFLPGEVPSEQDAPLAYVHSDDTLEDDIEVEDDMEDDFDDFDDFEEEEEGIDIYNSKLKEIADLLGADVENNSVNYQGHKIIWPSETEMYHVDKKKFKTAQEVVDYLNANSSKMSPEEENEMTGEIEGERNVGLDDIDAFESKSYRKTRLKKFNK